jgi:ABC-type molybdate transport system substrate-binding protein
MPAATRPEYRAAIAVVLIWLAGTFVISAQTTNQLIVCHAGSLQLAFTEVERAFSAQHPDVAVKDVSGGSVALAGRLAAGLQPCDVYAAADYLDIDLLLKPAGLAEYTIVFAKGRMVLAYLASDPKTQGVAARGDFKPPTSIPATAPDWYRVLLAPGVRISTSHPFLDPSGYRAHMIFRLAQAHYGVPNLANLLMEHVTINAAAAGDTAAAPVLGKDFNFQLAYEHNAAMTAASNPSYRYAVLPDRSDLSTSAHSAYYVQASVAVAALGGREGAAPVFIPASRVAWGLTVPKSAASPENALAFVNLLVGPTGSAALNTHGPAPISPALVTTSDYARLPKSTQLLVSAEPNVR